MGIAGIVREWNREEGWGVIDSSATPGGCWTHYSAIQMAGYKELTVSQSVRFTFEAVDQDGYHFRAVDVWPSGVESPPQRTEPQRGPSSAYRSSLHLLMDDRDVP